MTTGKLKGDVKAGEGRKTVSIRKDLLRKLREQEASLREAVAYLKGRIDSEQSNVVYKILTRPM